MQQSVFSPDRLASDRSATLFEAVYARELSLTEYAELVQQMMEPEMAFFLKNSYASLAYADGGD